MNNIFYHGKHVLTRYIMFLNPCCVAPFYVTRKMQLFNVICGAARRTIGQSSNRSLTGHAVSHRRVKLRHHYVTSEYFTHIP